MLKTLARCVREYKTASILSPVFVSIEVVLECLIPFVINMLIGALESGAGLWVAGAGLFGLGVVQYGIILVAMAVLSLATGALAGAFCARASAGFAKNVRKDLYYKVQEFSFENIDKFSTPSLVTRMTTDVTNVQMSYMMIVRIAIRGPLMIVFSFAMAFVMGKNLAWIFMGVVPVLAAAIFLVMRKVFPIFKRLFHRYDDMNESVQENVSAIRVVKSYVREDYEKQKFDKTAETLGKDFTRAERIIAWNEPIMQFAFYAVLSSILFIGSYLILKEVGLEERTGLGVGAVSQLVVYGMQILSSLMMFSMVFAMIVMSRESANRICEILNEKSTL